MTFFYVMFPRRILITYGINMKIFYCQQACNLNYGLLMP